MAYLDKNTGLFMPGEAQTGGGGGGGGSGTDIVPGEITDDGKFQMIDIADDGTYFEGEPEDVTVFYSLPKGLDPELPPTLSEFPAPDHTHASVRLGSVEYQEMGHKIFGNMEAFCGSVWISGGPLYSGARVLVACQEVADGSPYAMCLIWSGDLYLVLPSMYPGADPWHDAGWNVADGKLHHVLFGFSASNKKAYVAIDGSITEVLDIDDKDIPDGFSVQGYSGYIGGHPTAYGPSYADGEFDIGPVKIWDNMDLSERQFSRLASALYNRGVVLTKEAAIPTNFTSNTSIEGYVIDQSHGAGSYPEAWCVFNQNYTTGDYAWYTGAIVVSPDNPGWFSIEVPEAFVPTGIFMMNEIKSPENFKDATFQGSNNGTEWDDLLEIKDSPNTTGLQQNFDVETNTAYKFFRMLFTASHASGVSVQAFQIYKQGLPIEVED